MKTTHVRFAEACARLVEKPRTVRELRNVMAISSADQAYQYIETLKNHQLLYISNWVKVGNNRYVAVYAWQPALAQNSDVPRPEWKKKVRTTKENVPYTPGGALSKRIIALTNQNKDQWFSVRMIAQKLAVPRNTLSSVVIYLARRGFLIRGTGRPSRYKHADNRL